MVTSGEFSLGRVEVLEEERIGSRSREGKNLYGRNRGWSEMEEESRLDLVNLLASEKTKIVLSTTVTRFNSVKST